MKTASPDKPDRAIAPAEEQIHRALQNLIRLFGDSSQGIAINPGFMFRWHGFNHKARIDPYSGRTASVSLMRICS